MKFVRKCGYTDLPTYPPTPPPNSTTLILLLAFLTLSKKYILSEKLTKKNTVSCEAGNYKDSSMSKCAKCQGNKYSSGQGAEICDDCSAGSAANADKTECGKFYFCAFELHRDIFLLLFFSPKAQVTDAS